MSTGPLDPRDGAQDDDVRARDGFDRAYGPPLTQGAYGTSGYGTQPMGMSHEPLRPLVRNGLGTAALVLGIIGLLTSPLILGGLLGLLAVIFGFLGRGRAKRGEATNRGSAIAGIVLGLLAMTVAVVVAVASANFLEENKEEVTNLTDCLRGADTATEQDDCRKQFENAVTN